MSRRQISRRLKERGTPAGKNVVSRLLHEHGYRRRKPQKKRSMGQHADRNAQFERIAELKQEYLDDGKPVISIDTKKKEMLGNFHRDGVTDGVAWELSVTAVEAGTLTGWTADDADLADIRRLRTIDGNSGRMGDGDTPAQRKKGNHG